MQEKRRALGKGLEQLFSNEAFNIDELERNIIESSSREDVKLIDLSELRSNPYQPRKVFDDEKLEELATSIKEYGVIEPIIVKKSIKGYEIVAGERRTKASKIAGKTTIPAIIRDFNDTQMMEIALIENIQRENLNPIEEANAYEKILTAENITQEELAKKFGKSRSYITNILGILRLPENVKNYVIEGKLSLGHARTLSKLENPEQINRIAEKIISEGLNVRETEKIANQEDIPKINKINRNSTNIRYTIYENIFRSKIGSKVKITNKKIEIPFDSEKDLERVLEILGIEVDGE